VFKVEWQDRKLVDAHPWIVKPDGYVAYPLTKGPMITWRYLHCAVMEQEKRRSKLRGDLFVDHRYQDTLDNRRSVLRVTTIEVNNANRRPKGEGGFDYVERCQRDVTHLHFIEPAIAQYFPLLQ